MSGDGRRVPVAPRDHVDLFDDDYHRILAPFHPEAEARRETAAVRELLGLSQDDRVLDLGCGWGRHLRLLQDAGHDVVGIDLSEVLLQRALHRGGAAGEADLSGHLVAGDMLGLPFRDAAFDVVLNLATSLGLFLDDDRAVEALREARRVLRPAGRFLIEGMHRDDVVSGYAERDSWSLDDGTVVRARRRFDAIAGVSHEVLRWDSREDPHREPDPHPYPQPDREQLPARRPEPGLRRGVKRHSLRLRTGTETVRLLETAGLAVVEVYGGWGGEPFGHASERLVVVARPGPGGG